MSEHYQEYVDPDGCVVRAMPSSDHAPGAFVDPGVAARVDPSFQVPAHRLAEFCSKLYRAAGQPVPDLPVIYDPVLVEALAKDLAQLTESRDCYTDARALLDAGWRKQ